MNSILADRIIIGLEVIAIVAASFAFYDITIILYDIFHQEPSISVDTGTPYLLLMLIIPWMHLLNSLSKRGILSHKNLSFYSIIFFLFLIATGWGTGHLMLTKLNEQGYTACQGDESYRISAGKSLIYSLLDCPK